MNDIDKNVIFEQMYHDTIVTQNSHDFSVHEYYAACNRFCENFDMVKDAGFLNEYIDWKHAEDAVWINGKLGLYDFLRKSEHS